MLNKYRTGKLRILIAEDDFKSRMLFKKVLSVYGMCDIVVNGAEALEAFMLAFQDGKPYDLICLDIMMPEMDGTEALKAIRLKEKEMGLLNAQKAKIFMMTALDTEKNVFAAIRNKCSDYLIKPINKKNLIGKLKEHGLL